MKEKPNDDFLMNSEVRKINLIASSKFDNTLRVFNRKKTCIYYNKLIGLRGKYNIQELNQVKVVTFSFFGTKKYYPNYNNRQNTECDCSSNENRENLYGCIYVLICVFPPLGLLLLFIYICYLLKNRTNNNHY